MHRRFLLSGSLMAALAVMLGAFAAHGLRGQLDAHSMEIFQTANRYHFIHALGLLLIAVIAKPNPASKLLQWSGWLMLSGIGVFSGTLYLLAVSGQAWLGMITPLGGVAFIAAWLMLAIFAYRENR